MGQNRKKTQNKLLSYHTLSHEQGSDWCKQMDEQVAHTPICILGHSGPQWRVDSMLLGESMEKDKWNKSLRVFKEMRPISDVLLFLVGS